MKYITFLFSLLSFCLWLAPAGADTVKQYQLEDFFRNPVQAGYSISPDGTHLAFMRPWKNRLNVFVQKTGSPQSVVRVTSAQKRDIADYFWANNDTLAFLQDEGGDENYSLFTVHKDGSEPKHVTPFAKVQVNIIDRLKDHDDEMLISMNKRDPRVFDVYRLTLSTGKLQKIAENPGNISSWLTDHDGKLRVATATDGVHTSVLYRKTEADPFITIMKTDFRDSFSPLFMTFDNKELYVASNIDRDKTAIFLFNPETGKQGRLIFEHPEVDVHGLMASLKRKTITGVSYYTDKQHYHFFDLQRKQVQEDLERQLPGVEVRITDSNKDETMCVVGTFSDKHAGSYYLYDSTSKKLTHLADTMPWINEKDMATVKPIHYTASDGLIIHGYLTLPVGRENAKGLPVVIYPHDGPWARDHWGYNPAIQFLSNRGYAVLQMNFRGSTGYGKKFWTQSFKQWGRKMQDDITDGVHWLIKKGIADPKRIAIYGASYGGYAVLAGLTFTPDLYACGVDYVGVSNLFTLFETLPAYWEQERQMMYEMVGDPQKEKELLRAASPVFHIDRIKAPLFIAQGANDPRVKKEHSDQIVEALRRKQIAVEYMIKDNEGHGFHNEENRFDFYRAMEKFLNRHIGN